MSFSKLKKQVAEAIDHNDVYDVLELVADFLGWEGMTRWDLGMVRSSHESLGYLDGKMMLRREVVIFNLEHDFIEKHGEDKWLELRI